MECSSIPCLLGIEGLSLGGGGSGGGGGSPKAGTGGNEEGWVGGGAETACSAGVSRAGGGTGPRGGRTFDKAAFSPSQRIFTSSDSTNSAVNRRPPCGGHCRLYNALRVATASSTVEYYIIQNTRWARLSIHSTLTLSFNFQAGNNGYTLFVCNRKAMSKTNILTGKYCE